MDDFPRETNAGVIVRTIAVGETMMSTVVSKPYAEALRDFHQEIMRLASEIHLAYYQSLTPRYLIGRERTDVGNFNTTGQAIWCELSHATETPDGWEVVSAKPFSRSATFEMIYDEINTILKREPLWIFAD